MWEDRVLPHFFCLEVSEGICELRLLARLNRRTYCGKSTPQHHRYHNLIHARQPTPPPSTAQPFWLFPVHFSKPALKPFVPPKARKLPRRGWLDSLFSIEVGGLFPFHSLTPAFSPMGFTHAARMSEEVGQWWG